MNLNEETRYTIWICRVNDLLPEVMFLEDVGYDFLDAAFEEGWTPERVVEEGIRNFCRV